MRKAFIVAVLMLSVLHHALVMAGNGLMYHSGEGIAHAVLHWENADHHHHDDGSVHEEDSDESARHLHADSALSAVVLPTAPPVLEPHRFTYPLAHAPAYPGAPPFLEGPTRPPRLTA